MSALHPAADAPDSAVSPAATRAERRLAMLYRLGVKARAMPEAVREDRTKEFANAVAKLSRAIRLTMTAQGMFAHVGHLGGPKSSGKGPVFWGGKSFLF